MFGHPTRDASLKRTIDQLSHTQEGADKRRKIEEYLGNLKFDAAHYVVVPSSGSGVGITSQPVNLTGVPYWISDQRFSPSNYSYNESTGPLLRPKTPTARRLSRSPSSEDNEMVLEESSPQESDEEKALPLMAEIVELPSDFKASSFNDIHPTLLRKLSASKSPVMEALIYCAFNRWGVEIVKQGATEEEWKLDTEHGLGTRTGLIAFRFFDFDLLSSCLERVNAKHKPTTDPGARIKALKRWFDGIPCVRNRNEQFIATIKKTEQASKVKEMIRRMLRIYKRRLDQMKGINGNGNSSRKEDSSDSYSSAGPEPFVPDDDEGC